MNIKATFDSLQFSLDSMLLPQLGNGIKISFWLDKWIGDIALKDKFPRLYALDIKKQDLVCDKWSPGGWCWSWRRQLRYVSDLEEFQGLVFLIKDIKPSSGPDSWYFKPDLKGEFSVCKVRALVEDKYLIMDSRLFYWNNWLPIKVNTFIWRLLLQRLPTKENISKRGIGVSSLLCDRCLGDVESENHLFLCCPFAKKVWKGVSSWCAFEVNCSGGLLDTMKIPSHLKLASDVMKRLQAIIMCGLWFLWKARNDNIFRRQASSPIRVLEEIQVYAFLWVKNRENLSTLQWVKWCCNPLIL